MAWKTMTLRGKKIFARCEEDGSLRADGGRVEIRYNTGDGRAYAASLRNLTDCEEGVLPDSHCGSASRVAKASPAPKKKKKTKKSGPTTPAPEMPKEGEVLAYCDGACSGNPGPAGLGAVMRYDGKERRLSEFLGHGTNNIAELTAIQRVAEAVEDPSVPVHIYTDSSYAIGLLQKGWKAKANKELVADVRAAVGRLEDVTLHYVKGHAGILLNEVADELAVEAVAARGSKPWTESAL